MSMVIVSALKEDDEDNYDYNRAECWSVPTKVNEDACEGTFNS